MAPNLPLLPMLEKAAQSDAQLLQQWPIPQLSAKTRLRASVNLITFQNIKGTVGMWQMVLEHLSLKTATKKKEPTFYGSPPEINDNLAVESMYICFE